MTEAELQQTIRLDTPPGWVLFRNNTGVAYNKNGRPVQFGLCKGSADLIGWNPDGRFVAIEVKGPKSTVTHEQQRFINAVNHAGGIGVIARSIDDLPWR